MIRGALTHPKSRGTREWAVTAADEPALFWIAALVFFGVGCALVGGGLYSLFRGNRDDE